MTEMGMKYLTYSEDKRANLAREAETNRSNLAKEAETHRANVANETETHRANVAREFETNRSNLAKEAETHRANVVSEGLRREELDEDIRYHKDSVAQKRRADTISALKSSTLKGGIGINIKGVNIGIEKGSSAAVPYATATDPELIANEAAKQKKEQAAKDKRARSRILSNEGKQLFSQRWTDQEDVIRAITSVPSEQRQNFVVKKKGKYYYVEQNPRLNPNTGKWK